MKIMLIFRLACKPTHLSVKSLRVKKLFNRIGRRIELELWYGMFSTERGYVRQLWIIPKWREQKLWDFLELFASILDEAKRQEWGSSL